jgi:predicted transcriptional regulator
MEKEAVYIMAHPLSREIANLLDKKGPMSIYEIANRLGLPSRLIALHLMDMERCGLIYSELKSTGKATPAAVRYVELTQKAKDIKTHHNL